MSILCIVNKLVDCFHCRHARALNPHQLVFERIASIPADPIDRSPTLQALIPLPILPSVSVSAPVSAPALVPVPTPILPSMSASSIAAASMPVPAAPARCPTAVLLAVPRMTPIVPTAGAFKLPPSSVALSYAMHGIGYARRLGELYHEQLPGVATTARPGLGDRMFTRSMARPTGMSLSSTLIG
ncbi:hypothetical protein C8Q78DRAFT_1075171 [Trametes maxima]|nr:hypothetical protein C8Q78DRAFT_1075171 [Trametes maxima]